MEKDADLSTEAPAAKTAKAAGATIYVLRLYVAGASPRSARAISNVRRICDEYLEGHHDFEVVDISQHAAQARTKQIVAAPTLIKELPLPARRFVGDMSLCERILRGLDLTPSAAKQSSTTHDGAL